MANRSKPYPKTYADKARETLKLFVERTGSQEEAERKLDYDQSTISRVLNGELQAPLPMLIALREHMKMSLDEMLDLPSLPADEEFARKVHRALGLPDSHGDKG